MHQAVVFNKRMWVIGGDTDNGDVADVWSSTDGVDWHNYAVEEQRVTKEKRVAGLRVERGSAGQSVLAYAEESGQWEIDGRGIATNEAEVQDALSLNKAKLDALRTQLLGEINKVKAEVLAATMPIGFMYIQFPNQPSPQTLWGTGMTWQNVSSDYADCFFRAEGASTSTNNSYGAIGFEQGRQNDALQAHYHRFTAFLATPLFARNGGDGVLGDGFGTSTSTTTGVGGGGRSANETRPINYTVRIWKRTA